MNHNDLTESKNMIIKTQYIRNLKREIVYIEHLIIGLLYGFSNIIVFSFKDVLMVHSCIENKMLNNQMKGMLEFISVSVI